jgi:adenylate kinase
MLNVIFLGPPGAGKGTQALKIKEKYNLLHISTGDIFRKEIKEESEIGLKVKSIIDKGLLVPDDIVIEVLENAASKTTAGQGLLFDGFPRTIVQAEALDKMLAKKGIPVSLVVFLNTDNDELVKRMLIRAELLKRSDDTPDVVNKRLDVYKQQTEPLLEYYKKQGKLRQVKGSGNIDDIFVSICAEIDMVIC